MSVSSLPAPMSAFAESAGYTGPTLILAWQAEAVGTFGLCIDDEGRLVVIPRSDLRIDVRYNWNTHKWVDVNGVTDDDGGEDTPSDGGQEVS